MMALMTEKSISKHFRTPPHSLESERALLGAIMLKQDTMYDIMDVITPECFYSEKHRIIFKAIRELFEKKDPVDVLSLSTKLKEKNLLEQAGGKTFLAELLNSVPSATNAAYYAEIVKKKSTLRELIAAADYISELGYREERELEEILDDAEKKIFATTHMSSAQKFISIKDTLEDAWERIDSLQTSDEKLRGVPTGFAALDQKLSGLQRSDLIILAARPSIGKTSLALDIARQTALDHNIPVGIFSLEMSAQQLIDRMLSAAASVDSWKLRTGNLKTDREFEDIRNSLDKLSKAPIFIDDQPGNSITNMRAAARRLKSECGLGLIIVDYLQLMHTSRHYDSMVNQVTEISRSLKGLARELDVPVLALSQLSRAVEHRGGKPRLSDLRDSGSIEQDADVVMFIHRDRSEEEDGRSNIAEILIEKHRNGPTGKVELYFDDKRTSFKNIDTAHQDSDYEDF